MGLIRNAIQQGIQVAREVHSRLDGIQGPAEVPDQHDLVVVGAGPAGLACAVEAKNLGLNVLLIEQGTFGGTITQFPRQKLILTEAVDLPGHGSLERRSYQRDELLHIWNRVIQRTGLNVKEGVTFHSIHKWIFQLLGKY